MSASSTTPKFEDWLIVAVFAMVSTLVLGFVALRPAHPTAGVAVVFPPWTSGAAAIAKATAAGSAIVRLGRYPFVVVVKPETTSFVAHALGQGALAVLDPGALGGCLEPDLGPT